MERGGLMKENKWIKAGLLVSPLLLFGVLFTPYQWLNSSFLVDRLGCGCPQLDGAGNVVNSFNANDFTACFWSFIALCVIGAALFLVRKIPKDKMWLRVLYVLVMAAAALGIAWSCIQSMMWN